MTLYEYLHRASEDTPIWLDQFGEEDSFSAQQFFASRVVFYPGSGTDGHPVKLFGSTHSAHCFVYADYGVSRPVLEEELGHPTHHFQGYHSLRLWCWYWSRFGHHRHWVRQASDIQGNRASG